MEVTLLDHEKFEGARELASISMKIAQARALISSLDESRAEYLDQREREALERIELAFAKSVDFLRAVGDNHDELVKYRNELTDYCNDLRYFNERVTASHAEFENYFADEQQKLDAKLALMKELQQQTKRDISLVQAERKQIATDRRKLADEERSIANKRELLKRALQTKKPKA